MDRDDRYKIAVDIFYNESNSQQWHFNSHFIVHGIIISFLLNMVKGGKCNINELLVFWICIAGILLGFAFLLGYYRASQMCRLRLDHLIYLDEGKDSVKEFFGGTIKKFIDGKIGNPFTLKVERSDDADDENKRKKFSRWAKVKNRYIRYGIICLIIGTYVGVLVYIQ